MARRVAVTYGCTHGLGPAAVQHPDAGAEPGGHHRRPRPDALVTAGPYSLSRNPMYVGWALAHLGIGLLRDDACVVAALPVASGAVHRGVLREEAILAASFPAEFSQYRLSVPRYVPRLRHGWRAGLPLHPRR